MYTQCVQHILAFFLKFESIFEFSGRKNPLFFGDFVCVCVCELRYIYMYVWYNAICMLFELRFKYLNIFYIFVQGYTLLAEVAHSYL